MDSVKLMPILLPSQCQALRSHSIEAVLRFPVTARFNVVKSRSAFFFDRRRCAVSRILLKSEAAIIATSLSFRRLMMTWRKFVSLPHQHHRRLLCEAQYRLEVEAKEYVRNDEKNRDDRDGGRKANGRMLAVVCVAEVHVAKDTRVVVE